MHFYLKNQLEDHIGCDIWQNGKVIDRVNMSGCSGYSLEQYEIDTLEPEQGHSESTPNVTFKVLIINCKIDFIKLFIFNCLTSNINLFIFNCLTSNINWFNFNCLTSNFCFPKNIPFTNRREWLFMDAHP